MLQETITYKSLRPDGTAVIIHNAEFYPAYLLLPEFCFINYPSIKESVTRYPGRVTNDPIAIAMIESSLMAEVICDFYATAAWPYLSEMFGLSKYMEVYSGYDLAWQIAHMPLIWINELIDQGFIPHAADLFDNADPDERFGYISMDEFLGYMSVIVPAALERTGFDRYIQISIENRCIEDFDFRRSNPKTDFYRKWYHSRTKLYKQINNIQDKRRSGKTEDEIIDEIVNPHTGEENRNADEQLPSSDDPEAWNMISGSNDRGMDTWSFTRYVETKVAVNEFLEQIDDEDYAMLMMKFRGMKQQDMARELGLKDHSAVSKRMKRVVREFEEFSGITINKKAIRRKRQPRNKKENED